MSGFTQMIQAAQVTGAVSGVAEVDWVAISPVLAPTVGAVLVLLLALVGSRLPRAASIQAVLAVGSVVTGLLLLAWLAVTLPTGGVRQTFCVPSEQARQCGYGVSSLTLGLQLMVLLSALVCVLLSLGWAGSSSAGPAGVGGRGEYCTELLILMLIATAGAAVLAGARDVATVIVGLETASLPVIGLVGLPRDGRAAEAALKLLLTAVTSLGLLVLGAALVYAATGSLFLQTAVTDSASGLRVVHGMGLALLVAGAGFKLSLVPFHFWTPETYAGAPLPVAAFLSTVSKVAGLSAVVLVLAVAAPEQSRWWSALVGGVAAVTMTVGNVVALQQNSAVRLLAWSTIAQAGWVVLPLAGAVGSGAVAGAVGASLGYLLAYVVGTLAVFTVVAEVVRRHPDGVRHRLSAYRGSWRRRPVPTLVLGFGLLCLAGLPPGVMGVVAKVLVLRSVVAGDAGWWLLVVAVVNVVLGVAVYLRWMVVLFQRSSEDPAWVVEQEKAAGPQPVAGRLALSVAAAGCVALSLLPQGMVGLLGAGVLK